MSDPDEIRARADAEEMRRQDAALQAWYRCMAEEQERIYLEMAEEAIRMALHRE